jgi:hypothetical protein
MKSSVPASPAELADALAAIFPSFQLEELKPEEFVYEPPITFHYVMSEFASFFGKGASSFSGRQLQELAELIVRANSHGGDLENAIGTCFLEHARQLKVNRQLAPWLSKARTKHGA